MERVVDVAQNADIAAEDAGSGGTGIDIDEMTREALLNLLAPFSSGASSSATGCGTIEACRDAWQAAGQLPAREAVMAMEASKAVWPDGVPQAVQQTDAWAMAETARPDGHHSPSGVCNRPRRSLRW